MTATAATPRPHPVDPPGLGRQILLTMGILMPIVLIGVTIGARSLGVALPSAFGIGVFASLWGGGGFGAMIGGVIYAFRNEEQAAALR